MVERGIKSRETLGKVLLLCILLCTFFYDPIVRGDDRTKAPLFENFIGYSVDFVSLKSRLKKNIPSFDSEFSKMILKVFNSELLISSICTLPLYTILFFSYFDFIEHSMAIRAPVI